MSRVHVSDHALLRYLERVEGVDVAAARRAIARTCRVGVEHEAAGVVANGFRFKLNGCTVTTVFEAHSKDPRTGGARREGGGT